MGFFDPSKVIEMLNKAESEQDSSMQQQATQGNASQQEASAPNHEAQQSEAGDNNLEAPAGEQDNDNADQTAQSAQQGDKQQSTVVPKQRLDQEIRKRRELQAQLKANEERLAKLERLSAYSLGKGSRIQQDDDEDADPELQSLLEEYGIPTRKAKPQEPDFDKELESLPPSVRAEIKAARQLRERMEAQERAQQEQVDRAFDNTIAELEKKTGIDAASLTAMIAYGGHTPGSILKRFGQQQAQGAPVKAAAQQPVQQRPSAPSRVPQPDSHSVVKPKPSLKDWGSWATNEILKS